jgi:hypothetical protein
VPTATPAPSVVPSATASVEPSASVDSGATTEEALLASLLQAADLPADATGGEPRSQAANLTSAEFKQHNGLRQASASWGGGPLTTLFDIRFQFATAADAAAFLDADEVGLSEQGSGLEPFTVSVGNADDVRAYRGTISLLGVTTANYNFLLRVGNFVAKVYLAGGKDLTEDAAETIAMAAAARMQSVVQGVVPPPSASPTEVPSASPSASTAFNDDELAILQHVPEGVQPGCRSTDTIYGSEIDSVSCSNEGQPAIDYTSFLLAEDMDSEFTADAKAADTPATAKGSCSKADYEGTYTIDGKDAGQLRCMIVTGTQTGTKYRVIEWTNDSLLILSYLSSSTMSWDDLIAFWQSSAGPIQ